MFADFYIFFPYRYRAFSFQTAEAAIHRKHVDRKTGKILQLFRVYIPSVTRVFRKNNQDKCG